MWLFSAFCIRSFFKSQPLVVNRRGGFRYSVFGTRHSAFGIGPLKYVSTAISPPLCGFRYCAFGIWYSIPPSFKSQPVLVLIRCRQRIIHIRRHCDNCSSCGVAWPRPNKWGQITTAGHSKSTVDTHRSRYLNRASPTAVAQTTYVNKYNAGKLCEVHKA